jgi:predicted acyl esterase
VNHDRVKINGQFTRKKARQKVSYRPSKTNRFKQSKTWRIPSSASEPNYYRRKENQTSAGATTILPTPSEYLSTILKAD